jgi:hypothetical protein
MTYPHSLGRRAPDSEAFAPPRLLDGGSERERRLLGSARFDGVPGAARDRFAQALGIPEAARLIEGEAADARDPAAGIVTGGAPNVAASGAARLGKHGTMLLGVLGVVGAIVASRGAWPGAARDVSSEPARAVVVLPMPAGLPPPEERREVESSAGGGASTQTSSTPEQPSPEARERALVGGVASLQPRAASVGPARAPGSRVRALAASGSEKVQSATPIAPREPTALGDDARGLLEEVRWLEEVSALLKADQSERAARALTRYERRYPEGELAIEAALLRVELALAQGERSLGLQLARELLARPAASRYRARLSRLLGEPTRSSGAAREITGSNADATHMRGRR